MEHTTVDGVRLAYESRGDGEPVVLIHGGVCADFFAPLMAEPALDRYRLLRYHRAGYGDSGRARGRLDISRQAAHCRLLMEHLGIDRAHVVGHSSSAAIAVQLALGEPSAVHSLALLEMALLAVPSGPFAAEAIAKYRAGDRAAAVDAWLRGVCGRDYRTTLDRVLPGAFDRAVADADAFFADELAALLEWTFGPAEARRVVQPALVVLGAASDRVSATFRRRYELLLAWLPRAEPFLLAGANHLLQVQNSGGAAEGLAGFLARHPMPSPC